MVNARELMVQAMLSRVIAWGTKVNICTLPPDPMDVTFVMHWLQEPQLKPE